MHFKIGRYYIFLGLGCQKDTKNIPDSFSYIKYVTLELKIGLSRAKSRTPAQLRDVRGLLKKAKNC